MACTTYNFGLTVCTFPHRDFKNHACGMCSVTSLGSYDPTKGGHLVLWDLGLVVEFPPYSTILLPSAIILHGNTLIGQHEMRMTVTQYNASSLFLWSAIGNMAQKSSTTVASWWKHPKHVFSRVGELVERVSRR